MNKKLFKWKKFVKMNKTWQLIFKIIHNPILEVEFLINIHKIALTFAFQNYLRWELFRQISMIKDDI